MTGGPVDGGPHHAAASCHALTQTNQQRTAERATGFI